MQKANGRPDAADRPDQQRPDIKARGRRLMLSRRSSVLMGGAVVVVASVSGVAELVQSARSVTVKDAQQFLQQSGERLGAILNGAGEWSVKRRQIEALIAQVLDVLGIARFAVGRAWNDASTVQREEIVQLFPRVLVGNVARTIGAYQGFTFKINRGAQHTDVIEVWTTILRPGDAPREVVWLVASIDGAPKIVDIVAEGASMRITQRDDCIAFLQHNNHSIPALIETLRQQAEVES